MHFSDIQKSDTENTQMLELTIIGFAYFHISEFCERTQYSNGKLYFLGQLASSPTCTTHK